MHHSLFIFRRICAMHSIKSAVMIIVGGTVCGSVRNYTAAQSQSPHHQRCHGDAINKCPGAAEAPGRCFIFLGHGFPRSTVPLSESITCNGELSGRGRAAMGCEARSGAKHGLTEAFVARLRIAALRGRLTQGAPTHLPLITYLLTGNCSSIFPYFNSN